MIFFSNFILRKEGIPRIYLAANSGARIGLAEEVKDKYRVEWTEPSQPEKGFKYFYVTNQEYIELSKTQSIQAKKINDDCWMITDIIGVEDSLGVQNLRGSGLIAGETSKAYEGYFHHYFGYWKKCWNWCLLSTFGSREQFKTKVQLF